MHLDHSTMCQKRLQPHNCATHRLHIRCKAKSSSQQAGVRPEEQQVVFSRRQWVLALSAATALQLSLSAARPSSGNKTYSYLLSSHVNINRLVMGDCRVLAGQPVGAKIPYRQPHIS